MISKDQLETKLPPIIRYEDGSVNVVLVYHSDEYYAEDGSNSYIPVWGVSNTVYYHLHKELFDGWIELDCRSGSEVADVRDHLLPEEIEEFRKASEDFRKSLKSLRT